MPPPSSPARSFFKDVDAIAKYVCVETTPPLNLYLFLNAIYGGIEVACDAEQGTATFTGHDLKVRIPYSLTNGHSGQLPKENAIELAVAACRVHGVQGFCYAWTRRNEPIFKEVVATLSSAMGHLPWQLAVSWRIGRADLYDAVAVFHMQLVSEIPEAYRLDSLADRLFAVPWTLDASTGYELGVLAQQWGILAVPCAEKDARLVVAGVPLYIVQRDWAFLALALLFMPSMERMAEAIPEVSRARRMFSR